MAGEVDGVIIGQSLQLDSDIAIADVSTANADATYGQAEADLINELKTTVNALLAELRSDGLIKSP